MTQTNALAVRENSPIATKATDIDVFRLGEILAKSGYFQDATQTAQAVVKVLAGRELGFSEIASMSGIHIIKGKPVLSATLIACAVKRKGSPYSFKVIKHTDETCVIDFFEQGEKIGESAFSLADAKTAGLLEGANSHSWKKFPRNMLYARAMSNGAKWFCPDIFGGAVFYTPDELDQKVDAEGDIVIEANQPKIPTKTELIEQQKQSVQPPNKQNGELSVSDETEVTEKLEAFGLTAIRDEITALLKAVNISPVKTLSKIDATPEKAELALFEVRKTVIKKILEDENGWDSVSLETYFKPFGFYKLQEANLEQTGQVVQDLLKNKML